MLSVGVKKIERYCLLVALVLLAAVMPCNAQKHVKPILDPSYIQSYDTMLTTRVYLSQKYLSLDVKDKGGSSVLKYRPNSKIKLGVGATYGWFTVNISAGFGFMNNNKKELKKGNTKALDLQAHFYGPKFVIDLLTQYYKGFYLWPQGTQAETNNGWYTRPDLSLLQAGVSGYYVLNWGKFSYRATYVQSEWQIKSAGSFLLGAEIVYGLAKADSAFVPAAINSAYRSGNVRQIQFGDIGPRAGYAYTLVLAKHFFISGSATGSLSVNLLKETTTLQGSDTKFAFNPNYAFKAGVGYNSRKFSTNITWVNNSIVAAGDKATYTYYGGNARVHIAYRFLASPKMKQRLKFMQGTLL